MSALFNASPKDAAGLLMVDIGVSAPDYFDQGLPYMAGGFLAFEDNGITTHWHHGLPFTAVSRINGSGAPPQYFQSGAAPMSASKSVLEAGPATHHAHGVGYGFQSGVAAIAAVSAFEPSSLFAGAEEGGYYDASDLSTLWQDAAGTIPVTAPGQVVNRIDDLSGNGNHLRSDAANTGAAAPDYGSNGTQHWLEATQFITADSLGSSPSGSITLKVPYEHWVGYEALDTATASQYQRLIGIEGASANDYMSGVRRRSDNDTLAISILGTSVAVSLVSGFSAAIWPPNVPSVGRGIFESGTMREETNGVETIVPTAHGWTVETVAGGQIKQGFGPIGDRSYAFLVIDRLLTAQEATDMQAWLESKMP